MSVEETIKEKNDYIAFQQVVVKRLKETNIALTKRTENQRKEIKNLNTDLQNLKSDIHEKEEIIADVEQRAKRITMMYKDALDYIQVLENEIKTYHKMLIASSENAK